MVEVDERKQETLRLVLSIQNGQDRGDEILKLMTLHGGFIHNLCRPYILSGLIDEDEIKSLSFLATCEAAKHYDFSRGASYIAVLRWYLMRELASAANDNRVSPLPQHMREKILQFRRWKDAFFDKHEREPNRREILRDYGISDAELSALERAISMQSAASLDVPLSDDEGAENLGDFVEDENAEFTGNILEAIFTLQLRAEIAEIVDELPATERKAILERFYGSGKPCGGAFHRAMRKLRAPSVVRRLSPFLNENLFTGTGLRQFRRTQTSAPERLTIQHLNDRVRRVRDDC